MMQGRTYKLKAWSKDERERWVQGLEILREYVKNEDNKSTSY